MRAAGSFRASLVLALGAWLAGCIESPQTVIDYQAIAVNDGTGSATIRDFTITLSRADFAFGPVYFCAAASGSSTLCESSVAEITRVARVDGLAREPAPLGAVHGFTGSILSASYDFGISWFETSTAPVTASVAPLGHSMHLEAEAVRGDERVAIVADVDVVPQFQGQRAVPTEPVCTAGGGSTQCPHLESDRYRLEVHFDAARWFGQLDLGAIAAKGDHIAIEPGSAEHNALLVGIKNLSPPTFRWVPILP